MSIDYLSPLIKTYFKAFCDKDLNTIANILSQNVSLNDWNISATNKQNVLEVFKNIFDTFLKINVRVQSFLESDSKVYVEMIIELDNESIKVVDVFTIETTNSVYNDINLNETTTITKNSNKNLIVKISAYKQ